MTGRLAAPFHHISESRHRQHVERRPAAVVGAAVIGIKIRVHRIGDVFVVPGHIDHVAAGIDFHSRSPDDGLAPAAVDGFRPARHPRLVAVLGIDPDFVGTEMHERHDVRRRKRAELPENIVNDAFSSRLAHRADIKPAAERKRMSWNIQLRHHGNAAFSGVSDNFLKVLLSIIPSDLTPEECFRTLKRRIQFRFEPPAVIIGKMPMEKIHLVKRHHIQNRLQSVHVEIIAPAIVHKAAPAHSRPVCDTAARNLAGSELQKLGERGAGVTFAARIGGNDFNPVRRDFQYIRLCGDCSRGSRHRTPLRGNIRRGRSVSRTRARFNFHGFRQ